MRGPTVPLPAVAPRVLWAYVGSAPQPIGLESVLRHALQALDETMSFVVVPWSATEYSTAAASAQSLEAQSEACDFVAVLVPEVNQVSISGALASVIRRLASERPEHVRAFIRRSGSFLDEADRMSAFEVVGGSMDAKGYETGVRLSHRIRDWVIGVNRGST